MTRRLLRCAIVAAALLRSATLATGQPAEEPGVAIELLQGKWVAVEMEIDGVEVNEPDLRRRNYSIEFAPDKVKLTDDGATREFANTADKKSPEMKIGEDFILYQVQKNSLRLAIGSKEFPNSFVSKKNGPTQQVIFLRRPENLLPIDPEIEKVRDELIDLEKKAAIEFTKKTSQFLKDRIPKDAVTVAVDGRLSYSLDDLGDGDGEEVKHTFDGWRVMKATPDTFILIYKYSSQSLKGEPLTKRSTVSTVWARREGRWWNVFSQFTELPTDLPAKKD